MPLTEHEPWNFMTVYYDAIDHFSRGFIPTICVLPRFLANRLRLARLYANRLGDREKSAEHDRLAAIGRATGDVHSDNSDFLIPYSLFVERYAGPRGLGCPG